MPTEHSWDTLESGLAGLRAYDADPDRVERTRIRCVAALAAERRTRERRLERIVGRRGWLEPALAFGLSAIYLAVAIGQSLALRR
jgi:hypothetical protein